MTAPSRGLRGVTFKRFLMAGIARDINCNVKDPTKARVK
jgi:hypothetical protein